MPMAAVCSKLPPTRQTTGPQHGRPGIAPPALGRPGARQGKGQIEPLTGIVVDGADVTFAIRGVPGEPTFSGALSEDEINQKKGVNMRNPPTVSTA